jgi:hypothetical protein
MMKFSCGQSFAALATSRTSEYSSRCGNCCSTDGGKSPCARRRCDARLEESLVGGIDELLVVQRHGCLERFLLVLSPMV